MRVFACAWKNERPLFYVFLDLFTKGRVCPGLPWFVMVCPDLPWSVYKDLCNFKRFSSQRFCFGRFERFGLPAQNPSGTRDLIRVHCKTWPKSHQNGQFGKVLATRAESAANDTNLAEVPSKRSVWGGSGHQGRICSK